MGPRTLFPREKKTSPPPPADKPRRQGIRPATEGLPAAPSLAVIRDPSPEGPAPQSPGVVMRPGGEAPAPAPAGGGPGALAGPARSGGVRAAPLPSTPGWFEVPVRFHLR